MRREVGVAHARRADPDPYESGPDLHGLEVVDDVERFGSHFAQHRSTQRFFPLLRGAHRPLSGQS